MARIHELPALIVNKIAAGEVIERPAAVVKELVENALDAGARTIEIQVEEGGARLVRVIDDGHGIDPDDLALAFASHATSKISAVEDLEAVATLGFRGEALPSIGAVAECRLRSRTADRETAYEVTCVAGEISAPRPAAGPPGTAMTVANLFFNTPARRKFMKTKGTELGHITAMVTRLALAHPHVAFALQHDGREVLRLLNAPPGEMVEPEVALAARIGALFGREAEQDLVPVHSRREGIEVRGFVLPIRHSRRDAGGVHTFLNGRWLRDRVLISAVAGAYRERLPPGRHPLVFLHLHLDPAEVDVNVHPTKTEVRFRRSGEIHAFLGHAVRTALESDGGSGGRARVGSHGFATGSLPGPSPRKAGPELQQPQSRPLFSVGAASGVVQTPSTPGAELLRDRPGDEPRVPAAAPGSARELRAFQLHNAFLVEETADGIDIIDQHALHERILTERIRDRVSSEGLPAQRLLVPVVVRLSRAEIESLLAVSGELERFGIDLGRIGEESVAVHALPTLLAEKLGGEEVRELVVTLVTLAAEVEGGGSAETSLARFLDRAIYSMACRAAVKIGDPLSPGEIRAILRMRDEIGGRGQTCPHGRPTTLSLPMSQLRHCFDRE